MNKGKPNIEEITLSIALLGGINVVLLKVIDYFSNNSINLEANFKPAVYGLISFLLIELLIIFSYFIFKGISVYTYNNSKKKKYEHIAGDLFKLSFIAALVWFIDSIIIISLKYFVSKENLNFLNYFTPLVLYFLIIILSIPIAILYLCPEHINNIKIIISKFLNLGYLRVIIYFIIPFLFLFVIFLVIFFYFFNFITANQIWYVIAADLISMIIAIWYSTAEFKIHFKIILLIFIITLLILPFIIYYIAVPYLLTGSYSIEEFSPSIDNSDMRTFVMKEKGISYNFTEVWLYKLSSSLINDSNKPGLDCTNRPGLNCIDNVIIYRNGTYRNGTIRDDGYNAICSEYILGEQIGQTWYINIINISNLASGTYLLNAEVKDEPNHKTMPFGDSKRFTEKMFYISPERAKANYSFNCTRPS